MNPSADLEFALRARLADLAPIAAPDRLTIRVLATTSGIRPWPGWRALMSVAPMTVPSAVLVGSPGWRVARTAIVALLGLLLVAGAVVAGAILLERPPTMSLLRAGCPTELPAGVIANWDGRDGRTWLFEDGLLLTQHPVSPQQVAAADAGLTARRLSPRGVELVRAAIETDPLFDGGPAAEARSSPAGREPGPMACGRYLDAPWTSMQYRWQDGDGRRLSWGQGYPGEFIRPMTSAEAAAAVAFEERLGHPESWLPADAWLDPAERSYVPSRWVVIVEYVAVAELYRYFDTAPVRWGTGPRIGKATVGPPRGGPTTEVTLPGGQKLDELGTEYRLPQFTYSDRSEASPMVQVEQVARCAIVDAGMAQATVAALNDAGVHWNGAWWFTPPALDPSQSRIARVSVDALRPSEGGACEEHLPFARPPVAVPIATTRPQPLGTLGDVDPCRLLTPDALRAVLAAGGVGPSGSAGPMVAEDEHSYPGSGALGGLYRECLYIPNDAGQEAILAVHVDALEPTQARIEALRLLGGDARQIDLGRHLAWTNTCPVDSYCRGAVVLYAEPIVVALVIDPLLMPGTADLPAVVRALDAAWLTGNREGLGAR